jgi:hypothetical protein
MIFCAGHFRTIFSCPTQLATSALRNDAQRNVRVSRPPRVVAAYRVFDDCGTVLAKNNDCAVHRPARALTKQLEMFQARFPHPLPEHRGNKSTDKLSFHLEHFGCSNEAASRPRPHRASAPLSRYRHRAQGRRATQWRTDRWPIAMSHHLVVGRPRRSHCRREGELQ